MNQLESLELDMNADLKELEFELLDSAEESHEILNPEFYSFCILSSSCAITVKIKYTASTNSALFL